MDVKKFYEEIGGSYQDALNIMMNDALISRMLTKFIAGDSVDKLLAAYEAKDYRAVFAASHALKGVAGNLALSPIFQLASKITEATRNEDGVNLDAEFAELKKTYELIKAKHKEHIA
jgi:HPt (histidine-containing phosphotransfer) domain-containing protein